MNRLSSSQIIVFLLVFLSLSVLVNVMQYVGQTTQQAAIGKLESDLATKTQALANTRANNSQRQQQLATVNVQQANITNVVEQLRNQVSRLQTRLTETNGTALLTREQLDKAQAALRQNAQTLQSTEQQLQKMRLALSDAEVTIQNQQRTLMNRQQQNGELSNAARQILDQSTKAFSQDESVHILQSNNTVIIDMPVSAFFNSLEPILSSPANPALTELAAIFKQQPRASISIVGHADARPIVSDLSERYPTNWALSSARASAIAAQLVALGVDARQLTAAGKSANEPVRDTATKEAWQMNRRIEFVIR